METKLCKRCGRELPVSEFPKNKSALDGLFTYCKECVRNYHRAYRKKMHLELERTLAEKEADLHGLSRFTSLELMDELERRGYSGHLSLKQSNNETVYKHTLQG